MTAAASDATNVFVYGTLKRGFPNFALYLGPAVELGGDRSVPFLLNVPGEGAPISGEVYSVDVSTLEALDILEGISDGYYKRVLVPVHVRCSNVTLDCFVYMRVVAQDNDPLLQLERVTSYTKEAAQNYKSRTKLPNVAILALIHDLDEHMRHTVQAKLEAGESLDAALRASTSNSS
ncbi:hypothetical protein, variant [Aphanomyces invadans]|uniref:Gamma-glutamylcyclotransferase family protein n=1 Tax=Aphanomyces invadans TaxID=157072 RepID=A0A024TVY8_9STRA|nr:hypothetical protein, variant [Aphanomyces invadans]ETV98193.1 hypothetical protein, variant [Aphanomyces invadans]|eukprot:XP_008873068.1 hypothetical protein, variant [Aphanomyces invadans]